MPTSLDTLDRVPNNNILYPVQVVMRVKSQYSHKQGNWEISFLIFDTVAVLLENNICREEITKLK